MGYPIRTVISLGTRSPTSSSSLPAAYFLPRGGPPLAAYLTLLRLGFTVPPPSPEARWALTPPVRPCLCLGFEPLAIGGVFSVALSVACDPLARAQALPGSLPFGARTFLDAPQRARRDRPTGGNSVEI